MDLTERKLKILQAVIADFIRTAEPIGSRTISKNYSLGSPATIRNEMSDLEEMGYLTHPHTSSGRVPSEKAYRLYVNELMKKRELSQEEKDAIANELYQNVNELDSLIERAAHVLSEITSLTAFALTPGKEQDKLRYINLLPVDDYSVVLMLVSDSGKVSNTVVRLKAPASEDTLRLLAKHMTYTYSGKTLSEALTLDIIENLINEGIDAYGESGGKYFETVEVQVFLNLLRIIENMRQDVPLISAMRSVVFGFTVKELAQIRIAHREGSFSDAVLAYAASRTKPC